MTSTGTTKTVIMPATECHDAGHYLPAADLAAVLAEWGIDPTESDRLHDDVTGMLL